MAVTDDRRAGLPVRTVVHAGGVARRGPGVDRDHRRAEAGALLRQRQVALRLEDRLVVAASLDAMFLLWDARYGRTLLLSLIIHCFQLLFFSPLECGVGARLVVGRAMLWNVVIQ